MCKRILVVDDSKLVRFCLRVRLDAEPGLQVCGEAADGVEAVERAGALKPDLIVLDLSMPRMNGLQAATSMKSVAPRVPIILYTLHNTVVSAEQIEAAGISSVVSKTSDVGILFHEIRRLLANPGTIDVGSSEPAGA